MKWVWSQRLEGARADLQRTAMRHHPISEIAFSWGFSDPAHSALCDRSITAQVEVRTRLGLNVGHRLRDGIAQEACRNVPGEASRPDFVLDRRVAFESSDGNEVEIQHR